jgi:hypothetical protein
MHKIWSNIITTNHKSAWSYLNTIDCKCIHAYIYKVISFQGHKMMYSNALSIMWSEKKDCGQVLDMAYELQLKGMMKWQQKCTLLAWHD